MNDDKTIITQPQNQDANEQTIVNNADEVKNRTNGNSTERVAATAAVGVMSGMIAGGGAAIAANKLNEKEEETQSEEPAQSAAAEKAQPAKSAKEPEPKEAEEVVAQETPHAQDNSHDAAAGNPHTVSNPQSQTPSQSEDVPEVKVLGVYGNEEGQEIALLTDGETVAAVLDATGDGEANVIGVDENRNGQFEDGEIHDISDQHIQMSQYEQAYIAQHQEEIEQQQQQYDYTTSDEADYNNDVPTYEV